MTTEGILDQLNEIFREVLEDPGITLRESTTAPEVDGWDSLTNVELMVAIEKHFRLRFTSGEILAFRNVGDMCARIAAKAPAA